MKRECDATIIENKSRMGMDDHLEAIVVLKRALEEEKSKHSEEINNLTNKFQVYAVTYSIFSKTTNPSYSCTNITIFLLTVNQFWQERHRHRDGGSQISTQATPSRSQGSPQVKQVDYFIWTHTVLWSAPECLNLSCYVESSRRRSTPYSRPWRWPRPVISPRNITSPPYLK